MTDQLRSYLEFEAEFTKDEAVRFEKTGLEDDRIAYQNKRLEAKVAWEESGKLVPGCIAFRQ